MKLPEVNTIQGAVARLEKLKLKMNRARKAARRAVPFLDSKFLLPPGPNLLGAHTGKGKTNCFANQVHHSLKSVSGLIVCLLNEETEDDFYARIACIRKNLSFTDFKLGTISDVGLKTIYEDIAVIIPRVIVVDQDEFNLNCLEDVLTVIKSNCYRDDVSLILVDYLQNINETKSSELQGEPSFMISKLFGAQLKEYGKTAKCPILVSAQVSPGDMDAISRVQNDKTFGNHTKTVIELVTNFDTQETEAVIHKDRFNNSTGKIYVFKYRLGLLSFISEKNDKEESAP